MTFSSTSSYVDYKHASKMQFVEWFRNFAQSTSAKDRENTHRAMVAAEMIVSKAHTIGDFVNESTPLALALEWSKAQGELIKNDGTYDFDPMWTPFIDRDGKKLARGFVESVVGEAYSIHQQGCSTCRGDILSLHYLAQSYELLVNLKPLRDAVLKTDRIDKDLDDTIVSTLMKVRSCCEVFAKPYTMCVICSIRRACFRRVELSPWALGHVNFYDANRLFKSGMRLPSDRRKCDTCKSAIEGIPRKNTTISYPFVESWAIAFESWTTMETTRNEKWPRVRWSVCLDAMQMAFNWIDVEFPEPLKIIRSYWSRLGEKPKQSEIDDWALRIYEEVRSDVNVIGKILQRHALFSSVNPTQSTKHAPARSSVFPVSAMIKHAPARPAVIPPQSTIEQKPNEEKTKDENETSDEDAAKPTEFEEDDDYDLEASDDVGEDEDGYGAEIDPDDHVDEAESEYEIAESDDAQVVQDETEAESDEDENEGVDDGTVETGATDDGNQQDQGNSINYKKPANK